MTFSNGMAAAIAIAWGLLVWLNWFDFNPVSPAHLKGAVLAWAQIRPLPGLAACRALHSTRRKYLNHSCRFYPYV